MFGEMIGTISDFMYSYLLIIMLLAVGLYFTIRTRGVQLRLLAESIRVVGEKSSSRESVSAFQALMVSTASRVGTGNIVGVANAIAVGGYGAVFWMWIIALLGGASAFIESTLAQIYKVRDKNGGSYGGPSYYIQAALKSRWLGVVFAAALIATYAGGFNMLASFNLIDSMSGYSFYGDPQTSLVPLVGGGLLAVLVAVCVLGGGRRIVRITGLLVPFMGVTYILMALVVMALNFQMLPQVFGRIIAGAFDFRAIFGGFAGSALMEGIKRGLYSNEAGVGSAPNAAAAADVSHPVKQGLVQMLSVFIDTLLVCTATAMMCLCTGIVPSEQLKGAAFVQQSLSTTFGSVGPYFLTLALLLFAFTTLLGNLFYCEGCLRYITRERIGKRGLTVFRLAAAALVFAGAQMEFDLGLAVREDSENPVYYVQYAHARICTLLKALEAEGYTVPAAGEVDFSLLSGEAEQALIKKIAAYSQVVRLAARDYDPSHINRYLTELAGDFHRFYTACRIKGEERPVLLARLKLADTARSVLKNAMTLIGCTAPEKM